jgi:hypothetical protein
MKLPVLSLSSDEDGNVWVTVLPQSEKIFLDGQPYG